MPRRLTHTAGLLAAMSATCLLASIPASARSAQNSKIDLPKGTTAGLDAGFWSRALGLKGLGKRERLIVLDSDGRILEAVDGSEDRVLLSSAMADALSAGAFCVTLVHNHTLPVGLSGDDFRQLSKPGVERIVAVASDGAVYEATARAARPMLESAFFETTLTRVETRLTSEARREGLPIADLYPHLPHLVAQVMQRVGLIDYRVTPGVTAHVGFLRYRTIFQRVVDEIKN
jgi:hypothetical protein